MTVNTQLPRFKKYSNAIYFPLNTTGEFGCLYDKTGKLILESCLLRYIDRSHNRSRAPDSFSPIYKFDLIKGKYIFLGPFENPHFGHFLTEGLARMWYYLMNRGELEEYRLVSTNTTSQKRFFLKHVLLNRSRSRILADVLKYLSLDPKKIQHFPQPVSFEEIIIPEHSCFLNGELFDIHKLVFDTITKFVIKNVDIQSSDIPVYISRSKLNKHYGNIIHEEKIENYIILPKMSKY